MKIVAADKVASGGWVFISSQFNVWPGSCCGMRQAAGGNLRTNVGTQFITQYTTFENMVIACSGRPLLLATTVNNSYYQFVLDKCKEHGLKYIELAHWKNLGTGFICGCIIVDTQGVVSE